MGDADGTSISGSEPQMSPLMEATSPSEVEEGEQHKPTGRARGRGVGRGPPSAAFSSTHLGPKRVQHSVSSTPTWGPKWLCVTPLLASACFSLANKHMYYEDYYQETSVRRM
jgi:hypothetical protein